MSLADEMSSQNNNPTGDGTAPSALPESNPEIPSFPVVPTSVQNLFRRPALVRSEDREDINSLVSLLAKLLRHDDIIGWLLGSQFIESEIEVRRVSRIKAGILNYEYDKMVDAQRDAADMQHAIKVAASFATAPDKGNSVDEVDAEEGADATGEAESDEEFDRDEEVDGDEKSRGDQQAGAADGKGEGVTAGDKGSDTSPALGLMVPPKPKLVIDMDEVFTLAYLNRSYHYLKADQYLAVARERRNHDFVALQRHCDGRAAAARKITDAQHKNATLLAGSKAV